MASKTRAGSAGRGIGTGRCGPRGLTQSSRLSCITAKASPVIDGHRLPGGALRKRSTPGSYASLAAFSWFGASRVNFRSFTIGRRRRARGFPKAAFSGGAGSAGRGIGTGRCGPRGLTRSYDASRRLTIGMDRRVRYRPRRHRDPGEDRAGGSGGRACYNRVPIWFPDSYLRRPARGFPAGRACYNRVPTWLPDSYRRRPRRKSP